MLLISQHSRHAKLFKYIMTYLPWLNKQCSLIKDIPKIKTYNDFVNQLQEIEKSSTDIVLSYYKVKFTCSEVQKA